MPKKLRQKFKYLENEKMKWKAFFIIFEGLSVEANEKFFLESESLTLRLSCFKISVVNTQLNLTNC